MLRVKSSLNIISLERKRAKSSKNVQKLSVSLIDSSQPVHIHIKGQIHVREISDAIAASLKAHKKSSEIIYFSKTAEINRLKI